MATLYQRNGIYYLNYSVNGNRVRKVLGDDRRKAEIYLGELRYKLSNGDISPKRPEIPIGFFVQSYLDDCQTRLTGNSCLRYQEVLNHFLNYCTNEQPTQFISQITRGLLLDYVAYRQQNKPKPKNKTVNLELTVIRAALNWAFDREWIDKNPATRIKMLKTNDAKKGQIITEEEIERLMEGCNQIKEGRFFRDLLITFLNTGMRLGELINLTWNDVDMDEGMIRIQEKSFWKPKSYERGIPVHHTVKNVLVSLRMRPRGILVFVRDGKKIHCNVPRKLLIKVAKKVGLPHITRIHDLRHTFASNLLMKGVDIPTVQALLGHKSWSTTLIYSHQTKDHNREAINKLD